MKNIIVAIFICLVFFIKANAISSSNITSDEALQILIEGNKHFVEMKLKHPDQTIKRRLEGLKGQHPFVVILSCSDSRVPPELVFDQGLGDIFEVRNAGNVLDDHVIGSIEYAVIHLATPLVVVMGHQDCGAVKAAIEHASDSSHIKSIVKNIEPSVEKAKSLEGDLYDNAIRLNILNSVEKLKTNKPILKKYYEQGKIDIIGAYYHLDTGKVEFIK